jgi:hypothetical protein
MWFRMEYWVVFSTTGVEGRRKETRVESGECGENKTWTGEMKEGIYTRCIAEGVTAIRRCGLTEGKSSWYGLSLVALPDLWQGHAAGKAARCRGHAIGAAKA